MSKLDRKMEFEELLTPYVQNRLDKAKRQRLEELVQMDTELNEKLQFEIQLANNIQQSTEQLIEVRPAFHKLKQRIEAESKQFNLFDLSSWNSNWSLSWFNPGLALTSLAVLSLGAYLLLTQYPVSNLDGRFETLSNNDSTVVYQADMQYLRIVIAKELSRPQLESISKELLFKIESGPDSLNSYIISLSKNSSITEETLKQWRSDPRFLLVEPLNITDNSVVY